MAVKGLIGKCGCTRMVQGGYNVALADGDSVERHFMDTIVGGAWLCNQQLAWTLVTQAVGRVRELENRMGCFFDRNPDGTLQNALLHFDPGLENLPRAGIVHRLDKDTSGVMVVARSLRAHTSLVQQLQDDHMTNRHHCLFRF